MMREYLKPKIQPCACCGEPSELDCWQYRLCVDCWRDWHKNVGSPPSHYEIPKVEVIDGQRIVSWATSQGDSAKAWSAATEAWLRQAKARTA
jgi:hypothetical protein